MYLIMNFYRHPYLFYFRVHLIIRYQVIDEVSHSTALIQINLTCQVPVKNKLNIFNSS